MFETCEKQTIFPSEYKGNDIRKIRPRYIHITQMKQFHSGSHGADVSYFQINTFGFLQSSTNRLYTINLMINRVSL